MLAFNPSTWAQTLPLSFDQNSSLYRNFSLFNPSNTPPGLNWQSTRGVPISTNAADSGSDGRAPTVAQQVAFGTNYPTAPASPNQFHGSVSIAGLPVQGATNLSANVDFAHNVKSLSWPHQEDAQGNVLMVLRAAQAGAPYLVNLSSLSFGSQITPPAADEHGNALTNGANFTYWFPAPFSPPGITNTSYYFSQSAQQVFATQAGQATVIWKKVVPSPTPPANLPPGFGSLLDGGSYYVLSTNYYLVSGSAIKTPQKLYWTEGDHTSSGWRVTVPNAVNVNIIYNNVFPKNVAPPGDTATTGVLPNWSTNTLFVAGTPPAVHADNVTGRIFVELVGAPGADGVAPFLGFEIVDVFADPVPTDVNVELGTRVPAYQDGRDDSQLQVQPLQTTVANGPAFYDRQSIPNSAAVNLYATRETQDLNDFQAHWLITGVGGLQWPFIFARYHEYWPAAPSEYVHYVRPLVATKLEAAQTAVQLPGGEAPSILWQDDNDHPRAFLDSARFYTFLDTTYPAHRTLLKFISGNNFAYQRVFSYLEVALKTNALFAGSVAASLSIWNSTNQQLVFPVGSVGPLLVTNTVNVGERIAAPAGEVGSTNGSSYLAGYILQRYGNTFNPNAYLDPFAVGFDAAAQGAIIPVNAIPGNNVLEVLWFRRDNVNTSLGFQSSYWPVVIGHYLLQWPADAPEIVMANNAGTGPLDSLQAAGSVYRQPDPSLPGYNPNEEHALMLGGQAYALQDKLNNTTAGSGYTSDPFVLIAYTGADGRPAMAPYRVRREAPEAGWLFDYVINAGSILQAPMPLPLLEQPVVDGANFNHAPGGTSGDLPAGWGGLSGSSPLRYYGGFTYEDRKHEFWVYRGLNSGLPVLALGAYNATNNSFGPLPAATAVLNSNFTYYVHVSRQPASLSLTSTNLPPWLAIARSLSGFVLSGTPSSTNAYSCRLNLTDTDGSSASATLAINVLAAGSVVALGPLVLSSTNQYAGLNVTYLDRPPFLAQPPTTNNSFTMRFYYKNQASFDWPGVPSAPAVGDVVPFLLPHNALVTSTTDSSAESLDIVYRPVWPSLINNEPVPTLFSGDTLTVAKAGGGGHLAAVRGQSSVELLYQQSIALNDIVSAANVSATLFDPTVRKTAYLPAYGLSNGLPASIHASFDSGRYYFPTLPPHLVNRLYYDPNTTNLVLEGQFVAQTVGDSYLLLNVLAGSDLTNAVGLALPLDPAAHGWGLAVSNLSANLYTFGPQYFALTNYTATSCSLSNTTVAAIPTVTYLQTNRTQDYTYDQYGNKVYYYLTNYSVQVCGAAFNTNLCCLGNLTYLGTNVSAVPIPGTFGLNPSNTVTYSCSQLVQVTNANQQVDSYALSATGPGNGYISYIVGNSLDPAHASEPVTVYIARVVPPLARGQLKVLEDPNPLSEFVTFQHTLDLAGKSANYQFDWRIAPPVNGQPPTSDPTNWTSLALGGELSHFTLGGSSGIQSLADNYVAMRFRETDALADPRNTNWSAWTEAVLAEGYIKRVLNGINPFNQRTSDLFNNPVNTAASIVSQAGHRWEGDVALNASTLNNAGLIEIYETILHRGELLSINAGYNYGPANNALLLAAGYLSDLYSVVANDAMADAANPTIGIGTADKTYGSIATALFAFKGQEPSLLEEELALLRGRDDSLSPGVALNPVYNRLYWNYTRGLDSGEVIYALNYNILDQDHDGVVSAADAAILYPMGHGDAYGHYLTALGNYYSLLMNPNFDWVPQIETVSVLGAPVSVSYEHERKFAATASALARAGLQVFDLTWRRDYHAGTSAGWSSFASTNANPQRTYLNGILTNQVTRYWGLDHWACRTAQGAYVNWLVGNAILPPVDPDPTHQGIQKVDRTTVPELNELPQTADQMQTDMNNAEAGFTPLNLSQNAVPFDIDPLLVTGPNPQTHFEQIYSRAVTALNNAVVAFNDAQNVTQLMRSEEDSLADFQAGVTAQELAYNNQLIELYGSPYPDDMGPGKTYPQDYNGPDLVHYTYVETPDANDYGGVLDDPTKSKTYNIDIQQLPSNWSTTMYTNFNFIVESTAPGYQAPTNVVALTVGPDGFFDKPANWTAQRLSPGKIQQAISALVGAEHELRQAALNENVDKQALDKAMNAFKAMAATEAALTAIGNSNLVLQTDINNLTASYNIDAKWIASTETVLQDIATTLGIAIPVIYGTANDIGRPAEAFWYGAALVGKWLLLAGDDLDYTGFQLLVEKDQQKINDYAQDIARTNLDTDIKNAVLNLGSQELNLQNDLVTINQKLRAVSDALAAYQALVASGDRLQAERLSYRQHAAALVQGYRTRDAAFRVFQNEKLQRYKTLFDLAAKYAYLAAQAYDYETGLLGPASSGSQTFLNRIISAQALGVVNNGLPQYAGSDTGDPGLSSALAEMKADWDVVKGRLGFNNPDGYGTTVSLRTENYRILSNTNSDSTWQLVLQQGRVADLRADADVLRHCLQIDDGSGLPVPGIVLRFSTTVANGYNLFGNLLAAGDHNFSPSSFATKIFATGVCLDGYIGMDNPTVGGGTSPPDPTLDPNALAATPYVYLIPVGADSMRSPPLGDANAIRSWNVNDVAIPLPFNVSAAAFSSTPFYTSANSLSEPLFAVREHQAFRPVSTTSVFNTSIYGANGSLQPSQYTNKRLIGRSIWNDKWKLVIPGRTLLADPNEGLDRFIRSVKDIHLYFITYSYAGN